MKSAFNILMGSVLLIVGLNIGTQWGLTAKPVQIVNQKPVCNDIVRYEDGSLVCEVLIGAEDDAATAESFAGAKVTSDDVMEVKSADRQETVNAQVLHPTRKVQ